MPQRIGPYWFYRCSHQGQFFNTYEGRRDGRWCRLSKLHAFALDDREFLAQLARSSSRALAGKKGLFFMRVPLEVQQIDLPDGHREILWEYPAVLGERFQRLQRPQKTSRERRIFSPHNSARMVAQLCRALEERTAALQTIPRDVCELPDEWTLEHVHCTSLGTIHLESVPGEMNFTRKGEIYRGPFDFLSPERCRGQALTPASDVFLLGLVLYELTTGVRAFASPSDFQSLENILAGRYVRLSERIPDCPLALEQICTKAMASDPEERFASPGAFREALEALCGDSDSVFRTMDITDAHSWLRAQFYCDTYSLADIACLASLRPDLCREESWTDYLWQHTRKRLRLLLQGEQTPCQEALYLCANLPQAREELSACRPGNAVEKTRLHWLLQEGVDTPSDLSERRTEPLQVFWKTRL